MPQAALAPRPLAEVQAARDGRKGKAPTRDECRRLIDDLRDEWQPIHALMKAQDDLFYSAHKISLPKDVEAEGPTYVYTWKAAQQVLQAEGLLGGKKAEIQMAATNTRSDAARSRVELLQDHTNRGFDRLEQQSGEMTLAMVTQDVLKFGRGVDCLEPDPLRIGKYGKALEDFEEPAQYTKDRQRFIARMGQRGGRLPMNLRHVSPMSFMYREDPESGGLAVAIERRDRYAADIMNDPRYRGSAALEYIWRTTYESGNRSGDRAAGARKLSVWTIQTKEWTTQFITEPLAEPLVAGGRPTSQSADAFGTAQDIGEIAYQARNPLGRCWYTVTKGLRTSSTDATRALVGCYYYATSLIKNIDWLLTIQANAMKDQAWAPWIYIRGQPSASGLQMPLLVDPQKRRIKIARGNGYLTELEPGTIQQLISEAPPELLPLVENVRREYNLLLIPETLFDATSSSSGYELNQVRNGVLSKLDPIIQGIELAMAQRAELYAAIVIWLNEEISVSTVEGTHLVETYTFDPKEFRELEVTLKTELHVPRPEDSMADLQAAAYAIEKRLLDVARARERYLQVTNHDEVERAIALDDYKRSPKVAEWVIDKAATEAGLTLEQQAADAQGDVSVEQLLNSHPAYLAALARDAQPGTPGYASIMKAAELAGIVPPTAAAPQADPNAPVPTETATQPFSPQTLGPNGPGAPNGAPLAAGQAQAIPGGPRPVRAAAG
jgi:hypothetical protein